MKLSTNSGIPSQIKLSTPSVAHEILSPFAAAPQNKLAEELKKVDSQYTLSGTNGYNLPQSVGYTPLDYKPLTDDEIKRYAADTLAEYRLMSLNQINDGAARTAADLAASKTGLETAASKKRQEIDAYYDAAKQAGSNDALRRGLARSSVIVNKLNALENNKAQAKTDVAASLFDSIHQIDNKLNELETARLNALDGFDIVYAAKLGAEIQKLGAERQARLDDVIKYNNTLKSGEAQYGLDYAKTDSALNKDLYNQNADIVKNDLLNEMRKMIQKEKYSIVLEYLNGMSKSDAQNNLKSNEAFYKEQLGADYYNNLTVIQNRR